MCTEGRTEGRTEGWTTGRTGDVNSFSLHVGKLLVCQPDGRKKYVVLCFVLFWRIPCCLEKHNQLYKAVYAFNCCFLLPTDGNLQKSLCPYVHRTSPFWTFPMVAFKNIPSVETLFHENGTKQLSYASGLH